MGTPYRERLVALHERVRVALDPKTDRERRTVDQLGNWDIPTLEPLAEMAERAVRQGTAGAYDRGWSEGIQYAARGVCPRCMANDCKDCERRGEWLTAEGEPRRTGCCGRRFL